MISGGRKYYEARTEELGSACAEGDETGWVHANGGVRVDVTGKYAVATY